MNGTMLREGMRMVRERAQKTVRRCRITVLRLFRQARRDAEVILCERHGDGWRESGQGTTEYAILVGVLVVIAILAITLFRGRLQELWNAIAEGINSL